MSGLLVRHFSRSLLHARPTALPAANVVALQRQCRPGRQTFRQQGYSTHKPQGATDFELSLGKIVDTLMADYPALFERSPNFDIYDDIIVFELDFVNPWDGRELSALRGKKAYRRALLALQSLAMKTVREAKVKCSVQPLSPYDQTLRVNWTCTGRIAAVSQPLYISAISNYSIGPKRASLSLDPHFPLHRIDRHKIEFIEIHPPSLRSLLRSMWWKPQLRVAEPALAMNEDQFKSRLDLQVAGFQEKAL